MWLVLLLPSWLPALGWERIVQPDGVMYRIGLDWPGHPSVSCPEVDARMKHWSRDDINQR
jgi:hypothetical protein